MLRDLQLLHSFRPQSGGSRLEYLLHNYFITLVEADDDTLGLKYRLWVIIDKRGRHCRHGFQPGATVSHPTSTPHQSITYNSL
jgi:uncharacterized protein affecting Mg2+/Co2+ transport